MKASGSESLVYQPLENKLKVFEELRKSGGHGDFEFNFAAVEYSRYAELERQEIEDTVRQLEDLYRGKMPDVVIFERANPAGRVFARKSSVPTIEYSPMLIDREFPHYQYDENLVIVTLPRFFQKDADKLGSNFHFVGPVFNAGTFFEPWNSPHAREIILVSATNGESVRGPGRNRKELRCSPRGRSHRCVYQTLTTSRRSRANRNVRVRSHVQRIEPH